VKKDIFPEFVDYYHRASRADKREMDVYFRRTNYSCVDHDPLDKLYLYLYGSPWTGARACPCDSEPKYRA
jgi:lysine/ornithine N-monooxygenase